MVSVVTSAGAGLVNSSKDLLGAAGELGNASTGRAGERVTVNAANGNLIIQDRDEYLVGIGPDVDLLRTYNSQGGWDGDNGDRWRIGYYRKVYDLGGGTVKRAEADGRVTTYSWDGSSKYLSKDGSGQYDSLSYDAPSDSWTWRDGDTGVTESRVLTVIEGAGTAAARKVAHAYDLLGRRTSETVDPDGLKLVTSCEYDAAGRLLLKRDALNKVMARYSYDNADRLRYSVDAVGAVTRLDYDGEGRLTATRSYATALQPGWLGQTDDELRTTLDALGTSSADALNVNAYDMDGRLIYRVDGSIIAGGIRWRRGMENIS